MTTPYELAKSYIRAAHHTPSAKAVERVAWSLHNNLYQISLGDMLFASQEAAEAVLAMIYYFQIRGPTQELQDFVAWLHKTKPNGALEW